MNSRGKPRHLDERASPLSSTAAVLHSKYDAALPLISNAHWTIIFGIATLPSTQRQQLTSFRDVNEARVMGGFFLNASGQINIYSGRFTSSNGRNWFTHNFLEDPMGSRPTIADTHSQGNAPVAHNYAVRSTSSYYEFFYSSIYLTEMKRSS